MSVADDLSQWVQSRRRVGLPRHGTLPGLYIVDSARVAQNRNRTSPASTKQRTPCHHRLQPDGDSAKATPLLEKTRRRFLTLAYLRFFTHGFALQRKCWWDGLEVDLAQPGESAQPVKLWARRVWTLELSLVRVSVPNLAWPRILITPRAGLTTDVQADAQVLSSSHFTTTIHSTVLSFIPILHVQPTLMI